MMKEVSRLNNKHLLCLAKEIWGDKITLKSILPWKAQAAKYFFVNINDQLGAKHTDILKHVMNCKLCHENIEDSAEIFLLQQLLSLKGIHQHYHKHFKTVD